MPIVAADIKYRLSTKSGTAGDSLAQADPNLSLGKYMSTTVVGAAIHALFDPVTGADNAASTVDYRCIFVTNTHATLTLTAAKVWMSAEVAGGANAAIGLGSIGVVAGTSTAAQAAEIANETTAPSGVTFTSPSTEGAALTIGDVAPGQCRAVWVRRTAANTAAVSADGVTLRVKGDTAA